MLIIRQNQMQIFDEIDKQNFIDEVIREIREQHAAECMGLSVADLRLTVANGLERAVRYGLLKKSALSMFIQLLFVAGPDFDQYPPVRYLLTHPAIPPNDKIDSVIQSMQDADWAEMRKRAGKVTR